MHIHIVTSPTVEFACSWSWRGIVRFVKKPHPFGADWGCSDGNVSPSCLSTRERSYAGSILPHDSRHMSGNTVSILPAFR